ncbi:hypothetical protein HMJ29_06710 [Hymenobacter taeanensis]|uniref:DUF3300 domain-containing protein n=1 Tax=Hymenobacter taeanensis TaxID=2735321 RepID=A0A6M6BFY9_9BACT|nr:MULTISPECIES: hypothetical protein [Hymenobacter]QJX46644.1 hypothetical protein HMJ29_06710 [Hymenobacter taeanensis]UOQ80508.1 hypothetical protein MUN83_17050 [Hymenobacter sp. 5414T-23]
MMKGFLAAAGLTVAALALSPTSAHAQVTINIGRPAPQYVVVREARPVKKYKYKAPKHYYRPAGPVLLVPAGPAYYGPPGHGHGHGRGKGRH